MDESFWSEKKCSNIISALPLWIIEYAWSKKMMDVLEVLGPPLWLEGNWGQLTLQDACSIRAASAEAWMVIKARDIKHFERVMEFLDVTKTLLPHLVIPIKHMKIMFGLKTLVIMWMLWGDQDVASIIDKIMKFFPDRLQQYHRSSRRHMELMQKTHLDFRNFAQSLARNSDMRKIYIRDLMKDQYGEHYALKLEERLFHYLEELDKALPQPTYIEEVLKRPWPLGEKEELLQQLLTCSTAPIPTALKRLLRCALADYSSNDHPCKQVEKAGGLCSIAFRPSLRRPDNDMLPEANFQGTWLDKSSLLQKSSELTLESIRLMEKPGLSVEVDQAVICPCVIEKDNPQRAAIGQTTPQQEAEVDSAGHLCSRHGKRMKSILLECSEELQAQDKHTPVAECTPPSLHSPLLQSTPQRAMQASASPLPDSSSTNISLSSHPDSSSTNISLSSHPDLSTTNLAGAKASQAKLSQASLGETGSSVVQNTSRTSSVLQSSVSSAFSFLPHQVLPSSAQIPDSPSLPPSSSSASPLLIPVQQITDHHMSPSPTTQSSVYPQSSPSTFSFRHINSPAPFGHEPCSLGSTSSVPGAVTSPDYGGEQAQGGAGRTSSHAPDVSVVSEQGKALGGELKLSTETQAFLLLCKWLQPQVLLCRLSQEECATVSVQRTDSKKPELEEEEEENVSFDVNLLYSDSQSESDVHDSDDPDYVPSKKRKV